MIIANSILLLVYRNLVAAIDRIFLVWQIAFPVVYIFVARYSYSAMIGDQAINQGSSSVTYTSFLTSGIIGFNVMNGSIIAGVAAAFSHALQQGSNIISNLIT